jgi:hypothetical protein
MRPIGNTLPTNVRAQSAELLSRRLVAAFELQHQLKQMQPETPGEDDTADLFAAISHGVGHQLRLIQSHVASK